ncbi:unnamed protein product [Sphenostylis stenocarpa]|uniref:Uncharacterized protein n=1 Tax=Sphenostylis stenocarpa TaxID=92480 RepID=A0AA86RV92_9FABA|nr:unnamed protein product [Sphenostylis stenocarpa]
MANGCDDGGSGSDTVSHPIPLHGLPLPHYSPPFLRHQPQQGRYSVRPVQHQCPYCGTPLAKPLSLASSNNPTTLARSSPFDRINLLQADAADLIRDASLNDCVDLCVLGNVAFKICIMNFDSLTFSAEISSSIPFQKDQTDDGTRTWQHTRNVTFIAVIDSTSLAIKAMEAAKRPGVIINLSYTRFDQESTSD